MKIHLALFVSIVMIVGSCKTSKNFNGQPPKQPGVPVVPVNPGVPVAPVVDIKESELSEDLNKVFNDLVKRGFTGAFLIADKGEVDHNV